MVNSREEVLLNDKEAYVKQASIYLEGLDPKDVLILKSLGTIDLAKEMIKRYVEGEKPMYNVLNPRQMKALKDALDKAKIHKEYYSVLGSLFHVSSVEYGYDYLYNGKTISISPHVYNANMDRNAYVSVFQGGYFLMFDGEKVPNYDYDEAKAEDVIDAFEEGFKAHKIGNAEVTFDSKKSIQILRKKIIEECKKVKQESLGVSKPIQSINLVDYQYTYRQIVFLVPFYVFDFDLGNEIVTIAFNAYASRLEEPVINNPLLSLETMMPEGLKEPKFSFGLFLLSFLIIILGPLAYLLFFFSKKAKYKRVLNKVPHADLLKVL